MQELLRSRTQGHQASSRTEQALPGRRFCIRDSTTELPNYTEQEQKWLAALAKQFRRKGPDRVCLLTGAELLSQEKEPKTWAKDFIAQSNVERMCLLTQGLYLPTAKP